MSRQPVSLRQATIGDVPFLVELWSEVLRRADRQEQVHDLEIIVKEAAASAERRLLVADYDGERDRMFRHQAAALASSLASALARAASAPATRRR